MKLPTALFLALMALTANSARTGAEELSYELIDETFLLRDGPGLDVAEANCLSCHSGDYITTQPPGMGRDFWEHEVTKMIATYGAPIDEEDAAMITDYLAATY